MLASLIAFAASEEGEESSKTVFYICGGLLAVWAVIVSAIGIRSHASFPPSQGAARGVMALAVILVGLTMAAAVVTG